MDPHVTSSHWYWTVLVKLSVLMFFVQIGINIISLSIDIGIGGKFLIWWYAIIHCVFCYKYIYIYNLTSAIHRQLSYMIRNMKFIWEDDSYNRSQFLYIPYIPPIRQLTENEANTCFVYFYLTNSYMSSRGYRVH